MRKGRRVHDARVLSERVSGLTSLEMLRPPDRPPQSDAMVVLKAVGAVAVFALVLCAGLAFFIATACKSLKL